MSNYFGVLAVAAAVGLAAILLALLPPVEANAAATLPSGFKESTVFSGLTNPTTVQFSKDGKVFVAEKSGLIKVFDNLSDTTPTTFADLRTNVYNFWDRGLLGMVLDPNFPTNPYVYVLYTHDAEIGGTAPKWGTPGVSSDPCPNPPGATADGCVVSGRLSRLQADVNTNTMSGSEQVLIEDWCQQYPSHSVGNLVFGASGALYVSGGDGASFNFADYGQDGNPLNPCGDPPGGVGATLTPPTAEGGALRSQDLRTTGDPVSLDGTILRVDPTTGAGLPDNPLIGNADPNARRIIAYGLRNPFRIAPRPGTDEIWVGDVGWGAWEEINFIGSPTGSAVGNFGWPCYEGSGRQSGYDSANLNICENLYGAANAVTAPHYTYHHSARVVPGETCPTGQSSITGLAFYGTGPYPDEYDGALFFADYARNCIWVMRKGADGAPDPSTLSTFVEGAAAPVDLQIGPGGDLFYVDFSGGTIRRIEDSTSPTVSSVAPADGATGVALAGNVEATFSEDMDASTLTTTTFTLAEQGSTTPVAAAVSYDSATDKATLNPNAELKANTTYTATVKGGSSGVKDAAGNALAADKVWLFTTQASAQNNTAPTATITTPTATTTWQVDDTINFSGSAADPQDGALPASALSWSLIMQHCPSNCHEHPIQEFPGVASGSFTAPDHEYPSYLELRLTATDSDGLQDTKNVRLDPESVVLTFGTTPTGLELAAGQSSSTAPFTRTVIVGSNNTISATTPQTAGGKTYEFVSWSDGGARTHNITAPATATTYVAQFSEVDSTPPTVSSVAPADRATGVALAGNVEATFSEDMDASTLTTSTFTLTKQGSSTAVAAAVSYDSATDKATLNPNADLEGNTTYTATVKGGSSGVKDAAGNALASDKTWSFSTEQNSTKPSSTVLVAVRDTMIAEHYPTRNYGRNRSIGVDGDAPSRTGKDKAVLIKWDLSRIAPGTKVSSASVTLSVTIPSPQTYEAYKLKQAWTESAATWKNYDRAKLWGVAGAKGSLDRDVAVAGTITASATGKQTLTLDPAVVQSWVDNPASNHGIIIVDTANKDRLDFYSREAAAASRRPQLNVNLNTQ